ncbi:isoprenylcysteine carboxylmethyltransferase family protein [Rhodobacter sp.]
MERQGQALALQLLELPPVWVLGTIALAWLASLILPWPVLGLAGAILGALLVLAGLALMAAAAWEMWQARTTVIPGRQPTALVTSGVFGWSRNPIYLGDLVVTAGAMLWLQVPWALPMVGVLAWLLRERFILGEEQRLIAGFGAEYGLWAGRTGRWFGRKSG